MLKNLQAWKIGILLLLLLTATRGSHALTPFSLPDASLAIFLIGGLWLRQLGWFAAFFIFATVIDFGAAAFDPMQGFCLTNGYWGLIPAYGAMWLGGVWLSRQRDAFAVLPYTATSLVATSLAFVISTQTYYLFSGRFPNHGLLETIQYGWNYLPSYLGYTAAYLALYWTAVRLTRNLGITHPTSIKPV